MIENEIENDKIENDIESIQNNTTRFTTRFRKKTMPIRMKKETSRSSPYQLKDSIRIRERSATNTKSETGDTKLNKFTNKKIIKVFNEITKLQSKVTSNMSGTQTLQLHEKLEQERAHLNMLYKKSENELEHKLENTNFRQLVLQNIAKCGNHVHKFLAGKRRGETIELSLLNGPMTDTYRDLLIEIMVDIDSAIWESFGGINKPYNEITQGQIDRNEFRNKRRGLWRTAANAVQIGNNKKFSGPFATSTTKLSSYKPGFKLSGEFPCRNNKGPNTSSNSIIPTTPSANVQRIKWKELFELTKNKLSRECFLNENFKSDRTIDCCPTFLLAQSKYGRESIASNRSETLSAVGLFEANSKDYILSLSEENQLILEEYIKYLHDLEKSKKIYLGPHFCYYHENAGYTLHLLSDCKAGHFFLYQAECRFEGDRLKDSSTDRDDLFTLIEHISGRDEWSCILDPNQCSNFGRYAGGVAPSSLDDANCMAFTVIANNHYHILIVLVKDSKAGDALQYYYGGLPDEYKYTKISRVAPPS